MNEDSPRRPPSDCRRPVSVSGNMGPAGFELGEPSLADLRVQIGGDETLSPVIRAQWRSSIKRIGEWLERDLHLLPPRMNALRHGIVALNPAALGVSRKRVQNAVSHVKAALRHAGTLDDFGSPGAPLTARWRALYDGLGEVRLKRGLIRFLRYCSGNGIAPDDVNDAVVNDFLAAMLASSFVKKPRDLHRQVCRHWNAAADIVASWPDARVTVPDNRPVNASLAWGDFVPAFREDTDAYLSWLGGENLLAEDERVSACKPSTVERRREYLRLAASMAIREGVPLDGLTTLRDLIVPDTVKRILEGYLRSSNQEPSTFVIDLAERLRAIAKGWVHLPEKDVQVLDGYCRKLGKHRKTGLTEKNRAVVRRLRDPETRRRFLILPRRLVDRAIAEHGALHNAAVTMQIGLAIQILQVAPMRVANLAALEIGVNVIPVGNHFHLVIPDHDVKNGVALEYPLPEPVSDMLAFYLSTFRPRLKGAESDWLFPGENGHKSSPTLGQQITERTERELGYAVTAHQFRHIAAALILAANPGNFELVRRILGHKTLHTTIAFYIELENTAAAGQFANLIMQEIEDHGGPG